MRPSLLLIAVLFLATATFAQSTPTATLTASDHTISSGYEGILGEVVTITGSTVAACGINGKNQSAIFVFVKPAAAPWSDMTESAELVPPEGSSAAGVCSPAISGDANTIVGINSGGGLLVFVKPTGGWQGTVTPVAQLDPSAASKPWVVQGTFNSVAINAKGDTIVGGAYNAGTVAHRSGGKLIEGVPDQGAAYVFSEPPGGWANASQLVPAKLTASDSSMLGWAVGVSANTVVAGDGPTSLPGEAYVFLRPSTGIWHDSSRFQSKLTPSDGVTNDNFGYSIAIGNSGTLVAVGSRRGCFGVHGAAYVFAQPSHEWPAAMTQTAELTPSDFPDDSCFGESIAVGNEVVSVGGFASSKLAGAAYTFAEPVGGWTDLSLPASMVGGTGSGYFGFWESLNGPSTAVGAPQTTVNGDIGAGAVYIFSN